MKVGGLCNILHRVASFIYVHVFYIIINYHFDFSIIRYNLGNIHSSFQAAFKEIHFWFLFKYFSSLGVFRRCLASDK